MIRVFGLGFALLLGGCGLQPLYSGGQSGAVATSLSSIRVGPIPERGGWLVRNALVDRLGGESANPTYRLEVELDDDVTGFVGEAGRIRFDRVWQDDEAFGIAETLEQADRQRTRTCLVGAVEQVEADRRIGPFKRAGEAALFGLHWPGARCRRLANSASRATI